MPFVFDRGDVDGYGGAEDNGRGRICGQAAYYIGVTIGPNAGIRLY